MGHFIVSSKINLMNSTINDVIAEADYSTLCPDGTFVQLKYIENEDDNGKIKVQPGVFRIIKKNHRLELGPSSFSNDAILSTFSITELVCSQIDKFFSKLHIYKKYGIETPRRGLLLYGPPGGGKSTIISEISRKYSEDGESTVLIWETSKFEAWMVKDLIKSFDYQGVKKLILIAEDIGGIEMDQVKMKSDSDLLSLLDNIERTFTIPTVIIATTNFPEIFLGNLTNRPQRFDTKIEVPKPTAEQRVQLFNFFYKEDTGEDVKAELMKKKYEDFTPAHLKEIIIRAELEEVTLLKSIELVEKEIQVFKKEFQKNKSNKFGLE